MSSRGVVVRWRWLLAAAVSAAAFVAIVFVIFLRSNPSADPRPLGSVKDIAGLQKRSDLNVLFVVVDTVRAERLGAYGYERETSPVLERLAESGVRFERHLAQSSWTKCSMASLWTGMYPARTGVTRYDHMLSEEALMPAEVLKEAGFRTVGLYRNGWVAANFGFAQGFDVYTRPSAGPMPAGLRQKNPTIKLGGSDDDVIQTAIEYLRVNGRERWFLYLHLMDVHEYTYDEESALFGGDYSDIYDNAILHTDYVIGTLLESLDEQGFADNTLVIIGADHGEAFLERGVEGHARQVYRESTEIPLFVSFPFRLERPIVVRERTQNVDIWPTVFDLLGLPPLPDSDGRSLVADIIASDATDQSGAAAGPPRTAIAHLDQRWGQNGKDPFASVAVARGNKRYVVAEKGGRRIERLFDAELDPRELVDRSEQEPEELARLRALAESYLETTPPWGAAPKRDINEMELNQLRALGYALP